MSFNHAFSAHERSLLEQELMMQQLAQAQANHNALTRNNFFPVGAGYSSLASPGSSARDALLGLGNFSSSRHSSVPSSNTALDAAATMLMARSQSMSGRNNLLPSAFGLGFSGPLGLSSLGFPNMNTNRPSMTVPTSIGALQLDYLRAEQELHERRQVLEMQIRARAAAQQQQQQQAVAVASLGPNAQPAQLARQKIPQTNPLTNSHDLERLMLLQNAACSVKEHSASSSSSSSGEEQEDLSSASGTHQQQRAASEQKQGENSQENKTDKKSNRSTFAPIRKRGTIKAKKIIKDEYGNKEKKAKPEAGQKNKSKWNAYFESLKEYKEETGDCCVPRGFSENPKLASWVAEQRKQYKLFVSGKPNSITMERILLLESLDFAWKQQEVAWEKHKQQLADYFQEYGHCSVPLNHPRYPGLGNWIKQQRRLYKRKLIGFADSQLPEERIQALAELGFDWNSTSKRKLAVVASTSSAGFSKKKASMKKQKPMVTTTFKRTAQELPVTKRAPHRSNSDESLPLKKRRRVSSVEV